MRVMDEMEVVVVVVMRVVGGRKEGRVGYGSNGAIRRDEGEGSYGGGGMGRFCYCFI